MRPVTRENRLGKVIIVSASILLVPRSLKGRLMMETAIPDLRKVI